MHHPHRYFIAGGESLQAIENFVAEEREGYDRRAAMNRFREEHGVRDVLTRAGGDLAFRFNRAAGPGWRQIYSATEYFVPDTNTDQGRKIRDELEEVQDRGNAQVRFAKWMGADRVDTEPGRESHFAAFPSEASARFERLGDRYVISVPVVNYEDGENWATPKGAVPLAVSAYFKLHEEAGSLALKPTSTGHKIYAPDLDIIGIGER